MWKIIVSIAVALLVATLIFGGGYACANLSKTKDKSGVENDIAEKKEDERYLTIINETGQIINEVYITVGEGTEINAAHKVNPKKESFSVKIPDDYDEYSIFHVTLKDRYGFLYAVKTC